MSEREELRTLIDENSRMDWDGRVLDAIIAAGYRKVGKRFTDSELAAEFWHSWSCLKTGSATQRDWTEYDRAVTLRRLATTKAVNFDGQVR